METGLLGGRRGISPIDISASGMRAQRLRIELISNNIANAQTTNGGEEIVQGSDGQSYVRYHPYRRKVALFEPGVPGQSRDLGVTVSAVAEDPTDFQSRQEPEHPHSVKVPGAPDFGRLYLPNVDTMVEMVDMIAASRAYEANVTAVDTLKSMGAANLRILA